MVRAYRWRILGAFAIVFIAIALSISRPSEGESKSRSSKPPNPDDAALVSRHDAEAERVARGLAISPVPLDLKGKDRSLVGLGSYIVNAQGLCFGCHTNPPFLKNGNPNFGYPEKIDAAHYMGGGRVFPSRPGLNLYPVVSTNLTPDKNGNPGGLDFNTFVNAMRNGYRSRLDHDPLSYRGSTLALARRTGKLDPGRQLEVMPWAIYRSMTDYDLRAIYEYLRAIPRAQAGN